MTDTLISKLVDEARTELHASYYRGYPEEACLLLLERRVRQTAKAVAEALMVQQKPDLDAEPGFMVTAEYRLGEIRGYNQAVADLKKKLGEIGAPSQ